MKNKEPLSPKILTSLNNHIHKRSITSKVSNGKIVPNSFVKKNSLTSSTHINKTNLFNCNIYIPYTKLLIINSIL